MQSGRDEALAARRSGRFGAAAAAWHGLLRRDPDDWRTALELKQDLASAYLYSESDPLFRHAARAFPDAEWLAHYGGLYTFHMADLPWLAARGRAMLADRPNDMAVHRVLAEVLLQQRQWAAAERHLGQAEPTPATLAKLALAGLYRRLGAARRNRAESGAPYGIALINLDGNPGRRADIRQAFRRSAAPLFRVPGVLGRLLPVAALPRLGADPALRGTLGCFLSHVSAWETMLARGLDHCLVIEDDVVPLLPLPARLGLLALPDDYDVCFVNDRLQPVLPAADIAAARSFTPVPFPTAFATFPPEDNAPGADGYLISRAGARKLLDWVRQDGFAHDVDWRMVAYALTPDQCAALPRGHAHGVLAALAPAIPRPDRLRAFVLHPALIRTVPISSDREDGDRHPPG